MNQWNNYLILSKWMSKLFNYLDRYYLKFTSLDSTVQAAIKYFKEMIFQGIKEKLIGAILEEINKWRQNEDVNWDVIHLVIEAFISIGITKNAKITKGTAGEGSLKWDGE